MVKMLYIVLLIAVIISGCSPSDIPGETFTSEDALTSVALTVNAKLAVTDEPTFTSTPPATQTPSSTPTSMNVPSATLTGSPSPTTQNTVLPEPSSCEGATFVSDLTIPDGTEILPGSVFTKTWRIQNSGSCTWSPSYVFAFSSGSIMEATSPISMTVDTVQPGETVDIAIKMLAPDTPGQHIGYWSMQNADGIFFGDIVYVDILVIDFDEIPTPTNTSLTPTPTRRFQPRATATP